MPIDPPPLEIIFEDNHLLVVNKPAMVPTMGAPAGRPSLLNQAKDDVKRRYQKPGNVYLGTVSRLDAPVTGVVVFARTSKAASRLSQQMRDNEFEKVYWAIVRGAPTPESKDCVDWVIHDDRHRRMHIADPAAEGAKEARLSFHRLERLPRGDLLEVQLETGRKHQIRLQLSTRGYAVVGDRKYGSKEPFPHGIALHARRLTLRHPVRQEAMTFTAPLPSSWQQFGISDQASR